MTSDDSKNCIHGMVKAECQTCTTGGVVYTLKYVSVSKPKSLCKVAGAEWPTQKSALRSAQDSANFFNTTYKVYRDGKFVVSVKPK